MWLYLVHFFVIIARNDLFAWAKAISSSLVFIFGTQILEIYTIWKIYVLIVRTFLSSRNVAHLAPIGGKNLCFFCKVLEGKREIRLPKKPKPFALTILNYKLSINTP
jgi:hypothetical protein